MRSGQTSLLLYFILFRESTNTTDTPLFRFRFLHPLQSLQMGLVSALRTVLIGTTTLCISTLPALCLAQSVDPQNNVDPISRDICIVGGGSSGIYSAIRLLDMGKSVIVVEKKNHLGGNTETYIDPVTGAPINIGVVVWHNNSLVTSYFARLNVPLTPISFSGSPIITKYADFDTGQILSTYSPPDPTLALQTYVAQLFQYPYLDNGFDLPDPVPSDLLLPFGDFVTKYNIANALDIILSITQGIGNLLEVPTIYVMKLFGLSIVDGLQNGFLTTASHDNSQLYQSAQTVLTAANGLLLNSHVVSTVRDNSGAQITVSTPAGQKLINCNKIVLGIPPTVQNLVPFDFNGTELSLFQQFSTTGYYSGLLRNSGIPDNISINNIGSQTPYNLPDLPGLYAILATGVPGLHQVLYGSSTSLPDERVKQDILKSVKKLQSAGTIPVTTEPEFAVFSSHSPHEFTVTSKDIKNGFYKKLNALQGERRLFFTGGTFAAQDSSLIWQFTETLLSRIIA